MPLAVLVPAATLVLAILIWRGCLRGNVFDHAPRREVGLGVMDLVVGLFIMLLGMFLLALGSACPSTDQPTTGVDPAAPSAEPSMSVQQVLLGQGMTQLPVVLFLVCRVWNQTDGLRRIGILPKRPGREIGIGSLALLVALPLVFGVSMVTLSIALLFGHPAPEIGHQMLQDIRDAENVATNGLLITSAVVFAPILEEGIFRAFIQTCLLDLFSRARRWPVIFTVALAFALIHTGAVSWQMLPGLFTLGLVLGWLYERYGSFLACVLLHAGFNAVNVVLATLLMPLAN